MWNRDEAKRVGDDRAQPLSSAAPGEHRPSDAKEPRIATLGSSVLVKGDMTGSEDLVIDGRVEGRIELPENALTIGPNANIRAEIMANVVTVFGTLAGNITARDRVHIRRGASVAGNVTSPRIALQEGAVFCGSISMGERQRKPTAVKSEQPAWIGQVSGASDPSLAPARLMAPDKPGQ